MRNLNDLNNILFEQLERLIGAEEEEEIIDEVRRASAINSTASNVIENAQLILNAHQYYDTKGDPKTAPKLLMDQEGAYYA